MQSIREMFDPAAAQTETPIAYYKLVYPLSPDEFLKMQQDTAIARPDAYYFRQAFEYFNIKDHAVAKNGSTSNVDLPIVINESFTLAKHAQIVTDNVNLYKKKSAALIALDQKIIGSLLLAIVAASTPFIPFVGLISFVAWAATFYFLSQRAEAYMQYNDALLLLVGTCNWALGPTIRQNNPDELSHAPEIKNMMGCLYPVLSKKQVSHLIADDIETNYTTALDGYDSRFKFPLVGRFFSTATSNVGRAMHHELEDTALKQRGAEFIRCIYGLNRGSAPDFLRVVANALPDLWRAFRNVVRAYSTSPKPEEPTVLQRSSPV